MLFGTGDPTGVAWLRSQEATSAGDSVGYASRTRAAAPDAKGAASLVPQKADEDENWTVVGTQSTATMSGFVRPSVVGPCELYGSMVVGADACVAPTVSSPGLSLSPGEGIVPAATAYLSGVASAVFRVRRPIAGGHQALLVAAKP